jgi:hypothetical protein
MSATPVVQSGGFRHARKDSWLPSGDQCGNSPGRTRVGSPPLGSTAYRSRLSSPASSWSNTMSSPAPSRDAAETVAAGDAEDDTAAALDTLVAGADRSWSSDAPLHPVSPWAATTTTNAVQARASNHCLCHVEGAAPSGAVGMVAPFTTPPDELPERQPSTRAEFHLKQSTQRQTEQRPLPNDIRRMSDEISTTQFRAVVSAAPPRAHRCRGALPIASSVESQAIMVEGHVSIRPTSFAGVRRGLPGTTHGQIARACGCGARATARARTSLLESLSNLPRRA